MKCSRENPRSIRESPISHESWDIFAHTQTIYTVPFFFGGSDTQAEISYANIETEIRRFFLENGCVYVHAHARCL